MLVFNPGTRAWSLKSCLTAGYRSGGNFIPASGETNGPSDSLWDQILSPLHIFWLGAEHSRGVEEMFAICQLIHCITLFIHKSVLYELSLCEFHCCCLEQSCRRMSTVNCVMLAGTDLEFWFPAIWWLTMPVNNHKTLHSNQLEKELSLNRWTQNSGAG